MQAWALSPVEIEALKLSLRVSFWAVAGSLPLGVLAAWMLARLDFPSKSILDGLIHLPLVLPPVVIGYLLLVGFGRKGIVGAWLYEMTGLTLAFNWKGAAVAAAVMAFPLMVRAVEAGHSWALLQAFTMAIPVFANITTGLTNAIGDFLGIKNYWLMLLVEALYYIPALFLAYWIFWMLIRIPAVNTIFSVTTLTHYFKRFHDPETRVKFLMKR